jgi:hypothetical protein
MFKVVFATGWGLYVQDLAGFIEGEAGGGERTTRCLLLGSVFARCLGLLVGFGEGAAEDAGSGYHDLGDDAVSLTGI